jgi:peroxiredoxin
MQNLKQKEDLDVIKRPRCPKFLFVGTKAFMKVVKKGNTFFIYTLPSPYVEPCAREIFSQYHEFKDVFEKKNVNTLPKH